MKKLFMLLAVLTVILTVLFSFAGCSRNTADYKAAAVLRVSDDSMMFVQNADRELPCASITKLVTACTALKFAEPDDVFTVGSELTLLPKHASLCLISQGQQLTVHDLLSGMLMRSGSDAAYTVAVSAARISDPSLTDKDALGRFAEEMNSFAEDIGMSHSSFVNPDGQDAEGQFATVRDLTVLVKYALGIPVIREITSTLDYHAVFVTGQIIDWHNTNLLLDPESKFYSENAVGMKTGTTNKAKNCLAAVFDSGEEEYIVIVLGSLSDESRYRCTLKLFKEYAVK